VDSSKKPLGCFREGWLTMQLQEKPRDAVVPAGEPAGAESDKKLHTHGLYRLGFSYGRAIYRLRWVLIAL